MQTQGAMLGNENEAMT